MCVYGLFFSVFHRGQAPFSSLFLCLLFLLCGIAPKGGNVY